MVQSCSELLGAARSCPELLRVSQSCWELLEAARSCSCCDHVPFDTSFNHTLENASKRFNAPPSGRRCGTKPKQTALFTCYSTDPTRYSIYLGCYSASANTYSTYPYGYSTNSYYMVRYISEIELIL